MVRVVAKPKVEQSEFRKNMLSRIAEEIGNAGKIREDDVKTFAEFLIRRDREEIAPKPINEWAIEQIPKFSMAMA